MSKLLIFRAGDSDLAVDVAAVLEVVPAATLSQAHGSPVPLEGLLNLRGNVVPVVSLPHELGISQPALQQTDHLIVVADTSGWRFAIRANAGVEFSVEAELMADSKTERGIGGENESGLAAGNPAIRNLVRVGNRMATLLDCDEVSPHRDHQDSESSGATRFRLPS